MGLKADKRQFGSNQLVHARLDRVQIVSWAPQGRALPKVRGYEVHADSFVHCQTTTRTYARCRQYKNLTSRTEIYWQYSPQKGWLLPWKVTIVANDETGLSFGELELVLKHCRSYRFLIVELAIDFSHATGVNSKFIREHGLFGKSRPVQIRDRNPVRYFGTRKSCKYVRCYWKDELEVYRVELELHGRLLRRHKIAMLEDLISLPALIYKKHLWFVTFNWSALKQYLKTKIGRRRHELIAVAQERRISIKRLQRYLRRKGVLNPNRFLVSLAINDEINRALKRWERHFETTAL